MQTLNRVHRAPREPCPKHVQASGPCGRHDPASNPRRQSAGALRLLEILVVLRAEARCADSEEHQVRLTDVGDPLAAERRYHHYVALLEELGRELADLDAPAPLQD